MSSDFTFTKAFYPESSLVESVFYNKNAGYVVIDLNDELYKYDNVSEADVNALVEAPSVGHYYSTTWKGSHAPAEHLGNWSELFFHWEEVAEKVADTPSFVNKVVLNDFVDNTPTPQVSLADPVTEVVSHRGERTEDTREVSLNTPEVTKSNRYEVNFYVNGSPKQHVLAADSVRGALDEFDATVALFDVLEVEVVGVVSVG